jgi:hypothetical protein
MRGIRQKTSAGNEVKTTIAKGANMSKVKVTAVDRQEKLVAKISERVAKNTVVLSSSKEELNSAKAVLKGLKLAEKEAKKSAKPAKVAK